MSRAPAELWFAALSAAADKYTMDDLGVPSPTLMERAALCVAHEVVELRGAEDSAVVVLAGPGNNGGDGFAVARQLHGWGLPVSAVAATAKRNAQAQEQLDLARATGVSVLEALPNAPRRAIVVDALLGTGSVGAPRGGVADALKWQRSIAGGRVAIDLPSGVEADTAVVHPEAFRADLTVTFVRSKPGLHITPGREAAGRVVVADIGILAAPGRGSSLFLVAPHDAADAIERLPPFAHKGQRGHVAIVGGSPRTPGAAILAAASALRAGAGLATIVTESEEVRAQLLAQRPEIMLAPPDDPLFPAAQALAVGPGLTHGAVIGRLAAIYRDDPRPAIWDASALDHLAPGTKPAGPRIITPHPGEAARILGRTTAQIQGARLEAAQQLAAATGAVAVLKGAGTIVAEPGGATHVLVAGGPALATAGSGDCLAGLIAALLGRGMSAGEAARYGAHVHGLAGDEAAAAHPQPIAMHIADAIGPAMQPDALRRPLRGYPRLRRG